MINIGKILKRAWHILWNYKMLWVFGILLAMTGVGGRGGGNSGSGYQFNANDNNQNYQNYPNFQAGPAWRELTRWFEQDVAPLFDYPAQHIATWIWIGVALVVFILIVSVLFTFVRYISETALLRMVDDYEQTGTKIGFKQGWKLGWSRRAFRLWLIDLIIGLPFFMFLLLLMGLSVLIFVSVRNGGDLGIAFSVVTGIGCVFLFLFILIMLGIALSLLRQFFARFVALEDAGVGEAFSKGWSMFKRNWKSAALMWLVMLGISIGAGIGSMILFFLLIPVYLVLLIPAGIVAAIPGLLAFGIASLFASGPLAWILGGLFALPFFFFVLFAPLTVVSGWYVIYDSSVWTLTYREMKALEGLSMEAELQPQSPPA